ncbi:MAG TPA: CBS domain-containing protein [Polyangiaceae bacterium]|nr:CBS domain-containing protein [Polyangiaceae bacterium]
MQVHEIMTKNVKVIDSSATLVEAAEVMRDEDVGALPVGEGGRPIGMLTDRDIVVRALAEYKDPAHTTVREVITPRVTTIYADRDVNEAAELMAKDQVRRLLVIDHRQSPIGILSLGDIGRSEHASQAGAHALKGVSDNDNDHGQQTWRKPTHV